MKGIKNYSNQNWQQEFTRRLGDVYARLSLVECFLELKVVFFIGITQHVIVKVIDFEIPWLKLEANQNLQSIKIFMVLLQIWFFRC